MTAQRMVPRSKLDRVVEEERGREREAVESETWNCEPKVENDRFKLLSPAEKSSPERNTRRLRT